jgi:hypothetical protein
MLSTLCAAFRGPATVSGSQPKSAGNRGENSGFRTNGPTRPRFFGRKSRKSNDLGKIDSADGTADYFAITADSEARTGLRSAKRVAAGARGWRLVFAPKPPETLFHFLPFLSVGRRMKQAPASPMASRRSRWPERVTKRSPADARIRRSAAWDMGVRSPRASELAPDRGARRSVATRCSQRRSDPASPLFAPRRAAAL